MFSPRSLWQFLVDVAYAGLTWVCKPIDRAMVHLVDDEEDQW